MYEREKSPLTKITKKEVKRDRKRRAQTPFPPIEHAKRITTVAAMLDMSYTPLPGQPVYDESAEHTSLQVKRCPQKPIPLPAIIESPVDDEDLLRPESDMTITLATGEPLREDSETSVHRMQGDPPMDPDSKSLAEYKAAAIPPQARFASYII